MKLSEMNTRDIAKTLCALTQPVSRIAKDESLNGVFGELARKMRDNPEMTVLEKAGELMGVVPVLLADHYEDTIHVISIMTGKTAKEIEEMNGMAMIDEMRKCIDKQFLDFFRSSAAMAQTTTE